MNHEMDLRKKHDLLWVCQKLTWNGLLMEENGAERQNSTDQNRFGLNWTSNQNWAKNDVHKPKYDQTETKKISEYLN